MNESHQYYGILEPGYGLVYLGVNQRNRDRILKALPRKKGRTALDISRSWKEPEQRLGFKKTEFWMQMEDVAI